jgi:UDP-galactopyranose mutase
LKKKILIIGGGIGGCACANILNDLENFEITLVEKSNFLGAGVRTFFYGGFHPYTFGPRHFLTKNKGVYEYFNKIIPMRSVNYHEFITYAEKDNEFYHYPLNMNDIKKMPDKVKVKNELKNKKISKIIKAKNLEEYWINSIGETLYKKVIRDYNKKMWMTDDIKKIDTFNWSPKGATLKKSGETAEAWEKKNVFSCYPIKLNGYNDYFDILYKKKIKIYLNSTVNVLNLEKKIFYINKNIKKKFDIIINTISPEYLLDSHFGELRYIGRDLQYIVFPQEFVFPGNVSFVYYAGKEKFTRMVEYKKFTNFKSKYSLIGLEFPSLNGKHYPLPFKKEINKAFKYLKNLPEWYFSIGRAGTYRYAVDIDDCIEQALEIKKIIENDNYTGALPLKKWYLEDNFDNR